MITVTKAFTYEIRRGNTGIRVWSSDKHPHLEVFKGVY